jgi:hypothetical protein
MPRLLGTAARTVRLRRIELGASRRVFKHSPLLHLSGIRKAPYSCSYGSLLSPAVEQADMLPPGCIALLPTTHPPFRWYRSYSRPGAETGDVKHIWDNIFPEAYRPACRLPQASQASKSQPRPAWAMLCAAGPSPLTGP